MKEAFSRTALLLGESAIHRLQASRVALFGVGGVGSFAAEALARAGIGAMDLFDNDTVSETNLNRQLIALCSTLGQYKTDVMRDRVLDIQPECRVTSNHLFYLPETADAVDFSQYDYVIDCIDTVKAKIDIAVRCRDANVPLISSMGTGNKLNPTGFEVADLSKTSVCPLARVMRTELKKRGIVHLKVVYSREMPRAATVCEDGRRAVPGSVSFCPSVAGLILAGEVIKDLANVH